MNLETLLAPIITDPYWLYVLSHPMLIRLVVLLLTGAICFATRKKPFLCRGLVIWFFVMLFASLFAFESVRDGQGYVAAHLLGGMWSTEQIALEQMHLRWQHVLFPAYGKWIGVWLIGVVMLFVIRIVARYGYRQLIPLNSPYRHMGMPNDPDF